MGKDGDDKTDGECKIDEAGDIEHLISLIEHCVVF